MGDAKNYRFWIGGYGGYGGNGDGDDGTVLLWRLTVAVHGGGTRNARSATETCYVACCVRGENPFLRLLFFVRCGRLFTYLLFTLFDDITARKLLKIE